MLQPALSDGVAFDPFSFPQNGTSESEIDVGRCQVAQTSVISAGIVVIEEGSSLGLKVLRELIVFRQDAVLQSLVPPLDLALGLKTAEAPYTCSMVRCSSKSPRSAAM